MAKTKVPRKKMEPPQPKPINGKHLMCVKKAALKNIVRSDPMILERIQNAVFRMHTITVHATHFLKLYLLHVYQSGLTFPKLSPDFLAICMRVVSNQTPPYIRRGGPLNEANKSIMEQLQEFYMEHYEPLMRPHPAEQRSDRYHLSIVLQYEEVDMLKNINNNIFLHFENYCKELVNKAFGLKETLKNVDQRQDLSMDEKKLMKRGISIEFGVVKEDLLSPLGSAYTCPANYHAWLDIHKPKLIFKNEFMKNSLAYDIKAKTLDYLPSMINVCRQLENFGRSVQAIPLRARQIPSYITLDTSALIDLMVDDGGSSLKRKVKEVKADVWNAFFNINDKAFHRKDYRFHGMIKTDGVGCSILFHREDQYQDRMKGTGEPMEEVYVDDVEKPPTFKNVVGIDVGKEDLLHCTDGKAFYRYTANQRRVQAKTKKYARLMDGLKHTSELDGLTIKEWESVFSLYTRRTNSVEDFRSYLSVKLSIYHTLKPFYRETLPRKLRWNAYINTRRSEDTMLKVFRRRFGDPKDIVVGIGDWAPRGYHMRGKEPTKGKGFRNVLRRGGYDVFLVHEKNTSCTCYNCHARNEKFLYRENHNPRHIGEQTLVHGLLRCTSANECGSVWNRDVNASLNIRMLAMEAFANRERPLAFR